MEEPSVDLTLNPAEFKALIIRFPCFHEADPEADATDLMNLVVNAYNSDNLTEEQDMVVELALHLCSEHTQFNLRRALEIWEPEDRAAFAALVTENIVPPA